MLKKLFSMDLQIMMRAVKAMYIKFGEAEFRGRLLSDFDFERANLRHTLLKEECNELLTSICMGESDFVNLHREFADILVVLLGTAYECGVRSEAIAAAFEAVMNSQYSKVEGGILRREDGKILKGPHFVAPDIAAAIAPYYRKKTTDEK